MANRLPPEIRVDKKSAPYKGMSRGDYYRGKLTYKRKDGITEATAGVVAW
jgi:hypothetical protein